MERHKLTGNGLWESSRMIMVEHKERIRKEDKEQQRRGKPEIDEQEWELIFESLLLSLQEKREITILTFNPYEDQEHIGVVSFMDQQLQRIKLQQNDEDYTWIWVREIISAHT